MGRAGEKGKKRRIEDAKKGNVSWSTAPDIVKHMKKEYSAAVAKRKEVMGRMQSNIEGFSEEELAILNAGKSEAEEVSLDDVVGMMSESQIGSSGSSIAEIEAHLAKAGEMAKEIEAALKK